MSHPTVKHCLGFQGLWAPYSVGYSGVLPAHQEVAEDSAEDRILVLDRLLQKVLDKVGPVLEGDEGVILSFPSGPAPFTGLRALHALLAGMHAGRPNTFLYAPSVFELYGAALPQEKEVCVGVPHHPRSMFCGWCTAHKEKVTLLKMKDVHVDELSLITTPFYWAHEENKERSLGLLTGQECADYAWKKRDALHQQQSVELLYP